MCYSAQIERDWNKYVRVVGSDAAMNLEDFVKKYKKYWWRQNKSPSIKIPKAIDAWFAKPETDEARSAAKMIADFNADRAATIEQEIFKTEETPRRRGAQVAYEDDSKGA
jgi:hypothetical protein